MPPKVTPKELYNRVIQDNGQTTMRDLAREFDMQSPSLTHHVTVYAIENELPMPKFLFNKRSRKTGESVMIKDNIRRTTSDNYIQISPLRLKEAGFEETYEFRFVGDPKNRIILVIPQSQAGESVEEVISLIYPELGNHSSSEGCKEVTEGSKGSVRNLRLPTPNKSGSRKLQTS